MNWLGFDDGIGEQKGREMQWNPEHTHLSVAEPCFNAESTY